MAAPPGQMSYLSVFVQNVAEAEVVARVPAAAFEPAPEVDSAILRLRRRGRPGCRAGGSRSTASCRPASGSGASSSTTRSAASCRSLASALGAAFAACEIDSGAAAADAVGREWACLLGSWRRVLEAAA